MDIVSEELPVITNAPTYTIEGLLQRAGIISQSKMMTKVDGLLRVKGLVSKIKRYSKVAYLTLSDREHVISVKVDVEQPVMENQAVIVEGVLLLKPSTFFSGLEAYIDGHILGSWMPARSPEFISSVPLDKTSYLRFDDFLQEHPVESLMVLGTKTAVTDVLSHLDSGLASSVPNKTIRVGKKESLLEDLSVNLPVNIKAIAIVRGGDDKTMHVWDDHEVIRILLSLELPFYTALGHSHAMTLADRYADGSFHTPSALGAAINANVSRIRNLKKVAEECKRLERENAQLSMQVSHVSSIQKPSMPPLKAAFLGGLITVVVYLISKFIL